MARGRSRGRSTGGGSVANTMKSLFVGLAMIGIVLSLVLFVALMMEEQVVDQFITINDLDNETNCDAQTGSPCDSIRDGFDTTESVIELGLGLIGLIMIVLVFVGFLLPAVQGVMGRA